MIRLYKTLLIVLGLVALVGFIGVMIYVVIQVNQLHAVAISNRSAGFANPRNWMLIGSGLGLLGGFLLGVGVVMPEKSFKTRYAEVRQAESALGVSSEASPSAGARNADERALEPRPGQAADPQDDKLL